MPEEIVSRILRLPGYGISGWELDEAANTLTLAIRQTADEPYYVCGGCGISVREIHSWTERRLRDLPWGSWTVWLRVEVHRVRCRRCGVRTERLPFVEGKVHYTARLEAAVAQECEAAPVNRVATQRGLAPETVRRMDKRGPRDRNHRLLVSPMPRDTSIPRREGGVGRAGRGQRGLGQRAAQPPVPFARLPGPVPAGTLVVARAEPGPARQMTRAGEDPHIYPDLCQDDLRGALVHPREGVQAREVRGERSDDVVDLPTDRGDELVQVVQMGQQLRDEKRMMGAKPAGQRLTQRRELRPQPPAGQLRERVRVGCPRSRPPVSPGPREHRLPQKASPLRCRFDADAVPELL
jgi:zinc-finger of transposase IS204/IS1001/IS1096/IS1165/Helix-turn-helix domain of transposase family ISL3